MFCVNRKELLRSKTYYEARLPLVCGGKGHLLSCLFRLMTATAVAAEQPALPTLPPDHNKLGEGCNRKSMDDGRIVKV